MGAEDVALGLRGGQLLGVHEQRLRVGGLDVHDRLNHRVDLSLDVVRLVDHEGHGCGPLCGRRIGAGCRELAHDPEELEGVDGADHEVVVGVLAVVEVEPAEDPLREKERDDLLDIRSLGVVAGVHENLRLRTEAPADERGRSPVGQIGAVEGRLEKLVLDEQPHPGREGGVELLERVGQPRVARAEIVLARVVGAVGEPEADDRRADFLGDLDALEAVVECPPSHRSVRVADAAEAVLVLAEEVRVDRSDADPLILRVRLQRTPVVHPIPGNVHGDARTGAGQAVDESGVVDAFPDVPGGARPGVHVEARARVSVAPGRRLDLEPPELREDRLVSHGVLV